MQSFFGYAGRKEAKRTRVFPTLLLRRASHEGHEKVVEALHENRFVLSFVVCAVERGRHVRDRARLFLGNL